MNEIRACRSGQLSRVMLWAIAVPLMACGASGQPDYLGQDLVENEEMLGTAGDGWIDEYPDDDDAEDDTSMAALSSPDEVEFWTEYRISTGQRRVAPVRVGTSKWGWTHVNDKHQLTREQVIRDVVEKGQRTYGCGRLNKRTLIRAKLVAIGPPCCNPWWGVEITVRVGLEMTDEKPDGWHTGLITAFCEVGKRRDCPNAINQMLYVVKDPDKKLECHPGSGDGDPDTKN